MALKLTLDNPALPKGETVAVSGLGLLENGKSITLKEEQEQEFFSLRGETLREALKGDENFKLEGTADWKQPSDAPVISDTNEGVKGGE